MTPLLTPADARGLELPAELVAAEPPETRGLRRDAVRLMVSMNGDHRHMTARDLPEALEPGDILVINVSRTLPAAVPAGDGLLLHLSTALPAGLWVVEVREAVGYGSRPHLAMTAARTLPLAGGAEAHVLAPFAAAPDGEHTRLWVAALQLPTALVPYLERYGRPIRYGEPPRPWPLEAYQTVYGTEPGSAEMPSAGRSLTREVLTRLIARGVDVAPLLLHTGVSSQEAGETPPPERYRVPPTTAQRVNAARARGGRVVAVGTTVTRALETVTDERRLAHPGEGWTELVVTAARGVRGVDALLTGWHDPEASHLAVLEAVGGRELVACAYAEALAMRYRWHEFGDVHLIVP